MISKHTILNLNSALLLGLFWLLFGLLIISDKFFYLNDMQVLTASSIIIGPSTLVSYILSLVFGKISLLSVEAHLILNSIVWLFWGAMINMMARRISKGELNSLYWITYFTLTAIIVLGAYPFTSYVNRLHYIRNCINNDSCVEMYPD